MTPLPGGFSTHRVWGGELWVRTAHDACFPREARNLEAIFAEGPDVRVHRGRGRCYSTQLEPGLRAVLRHYRHGGTFAPITGDIFWGGRPRPVAELDVSEGLRNRGIRTPEVLAIFWQYCGLLFYRADIVTREVEGALNLGQFLQKSQVKVMERRRHLRAVGATVRRLHDAGLHHPDLNLSNLLILPGEPQVWVIDLDRARLLPNLSESAALSQLARLRRSVIKACRAQAFAGTRDEVAFLQGYDPTRWRALAGRLGERRS
jgi:3-deoxy-D-manno-octulosonic acid kinase